MHELCESVYMYLNVVTTLIFSTCPNTYGNCRFLPVMKNACGVTAVFGLTHKFNLFKTRGGTVDVGFSSKSSLLTATSASSVMAGFWMLEGRPVDSKSINTNVAIFLFVSMIGDSIMPN